MNHWGLAITPHWRRLSLNRLSVVIRRARRHPFWIRLDFAHPLDAFLRSLRVDFFCHRSWSDAVDTQACAPALIPRDHDAYHEKNSHTGFALERSMPSHRKSQRLNGAHLEFQGHGAPPELIIHPSFYPRPTLEGYFRPVFI